MCSGSKLIGTLSHHLDLNRVKTSSLSLCLRWKHKQLCFSESGFMRALEEAESAQGQKSWMSLKQRHDLRLTTYFLQESFTNTLINDSCLGGRWKERGGRGGNINTTSFRASCSLILPLRASIYGHAVKLKEQGGRQKGARWTGRHQICPSCPVTQEIFIDSKACIPWRNAHRRSLMLGKCSCFGQTLYEKIKLCQGILTKLV